MMAKPVKTLESYYLMIQFFLLMNSIFVTHTSTKGRRFKIPKNVLQLGASRTYESILSYKLFAPFDQRCDRMPLWLEAAGPYRNPLQ